MYMVMQIASFLTGTSNGSKQAGTSWQFSTQGTLPYLTLFNADTPPNTNEAHCPEPAGEPESGRPDSDHFLSTSPNGARKT